MAHIGFQGLDLLAASKARHAAPSTPVAVAAIKAGRDMCISSKKPNRTGALPLIPSWIQRRFVRSPRQRQHKGHIGPVWD